MLDYVLQPEMFFSVLVIALSVFGFLAAKACLSLCRWMFAGRAWSPVMSASEVQTEPWVQVAQVERLRRENTRLKVELSDAGEAIQEWQETFDVMDAKIKELQARNMDLINMRDFMARELNEAQDATRDVRRLLADSENLVRALRQRLEDFPIPREVVLSRRGQSYHTDEACTGLLSCDRQGLQTFPSCSFCATRAMMSNRNIS